VSLLASEFDEFLAWCGISNLLMFCGMVRVMLALSCELTVLRPSSEQVSLEVAGNSVGCNLLIALGM
jgi:hypothetical protein